MYTTDERDKLYLSILKHVNESNFFEGLLQIGSCSVGYNDCFSDIDLMAGCYDTDSVTIANDDLIAFFNRLGAIYIDKRSWTKTTLGLSVYFKNGLSVDISFSPTDELMICSHLWKIVSDKTGHLTEHINADNKEFERYCENCEIDKSIHHKFVYALRLCEIALLRKEYIYADMKLTEARQFLLNIEVMNEGKKIHQFKAYNTLRPDYIEALKETYPSYLSEQDIINAKKAMLTLYLKTVAESDKLRFDDTQLQLIDCFS